MTKDDEKFIHPVLVKIIRKFQRMFPGSTVSVSEKNDHEMSWRNGNASWTSNSQNGMSHPVQIKQIRVSSNTNSVYDNGGFQQ